MPGADFSDDGHHSAGGLAFCAVGEKFGDIAACAGADIMSVSRFHSSLYQLSFQCLRKVQQIFARTRGRGSR